MAREREVLIPNRAGPGRAGAPGRGTPEPEGRKSMPEISLTTAFGTVPASGQEAIRRVLHAAIEQVGQEEGTFRKAKAVFTESDEQCVFTVELDGIRREPNPLRLDLELLEDAATDSGAMSLLKEELRRYFRRVLGA